MPLDLIFAYRHKFLPGAWTFRHTFVNPGKVPPSKYLFHYTWLFSLIHSTIMAGKTLIILRPYQRTIVHLFFHSLHYIMQATLGLNLLHNTEYIHHLSPDKMAIRDCFPTASEHSTLVHLSTWRCKLVHVNEQDKLARAKLMLYITIIIILLEFSFHGDHYYWRTCLLIFFHFFPCRI